MKRFATLLMFVTASLLVLGCASTTVIDASWDKTAVDEINNRAEEGDATVTFTDEHESSGWLEVSPELFPLGAEPSVRRSDIGQIRFSRRNSRRGAVKGLVAGAGIGGVLGGAFGVVLIGFCEMDGGCDRSKAALIGVPGLLGAASVGLLGAVVGATVGARETTIYRFRPDTPQEVKVVIGVGQNRPL